MEVFEKTGQPKILETKQKKHELPAGLWVKCKQCGEMLFAKELASNLKVCSHCDYHFGMTAHERVAMLADEGTFEETDADLVSVDKLGFKGVASYADRLRAYQRQTGLNDAVVTGFCKLNGHPISLAVMDFSFLGASMGSVVGEKITRAVEAATERELAVVIVSTSGGARMYEGILSLMQMAKTSGALARHAQRRLLYISILTHPTTAGVMASFASLGDVILAEPKALIGFAGPRVIKETTQQELPEGFQTSEFLLDHGLIDALVHRKQMKATVGKLLDYLGNRRPRAGRGAD